MIDLKDVQLDYNEIYRYLGAKQKINDPNIEELVEKCVAEVMSTMRPRYTYGIFDIEPLDNGIEIRNSKIVLNGQSILNHMKDAEKAIIMAVTLGIEIELLIKKYSSFSITKAIIIDAVATEAIEKVCDAAQLNIISNDNPNNYYMNFRFSPGYGDLPMEIQPDIINLLDTYKKIGLSINENYILLPRKSVTAIFGFFKQKKSKENERPCAICSLKQHCAKRKEGLYCGNN